MKLTRDKKIYLPDIDNDPTWCEGYENNQFFQAMKYVPNRHTALDVGAHVGIWTIRLAQLFTDVIAFEPVPDHVECWYANTKTFTNVELNELALSNKSEVVKMKQARHSGTSSLEYNPSQLRTSKEIEVPTRTLDSFNLICDFMKVDVEGHELSFLKGAVETIERCSPIIFIEILKKERKKDTNAYDWLLNKGYKEIVIMSSYNYLFAK